mgnify:CR=1 FL=1
MPLKTIQVEQETKPTLKGFTATMDPSDHYGPKGAKVGKLWDAMGLIPYRNPVDPVMEIVTSHEKDALFDHITEYSAEDIGDRACFLGHECDVLGQEVFETVQIAVLGTSERHYTHTIHWIDHETYGRSVAIRSLSPHPVEFSSNLARVNQQYGLVYIIPDGDGARRVEAFWADAEVIGIDVPDRFAVDTAVNRMSDTAEDIDDLIDGVTE